MTFRNPHARQDNPTARTPGGAHPAVTAGGPDGRAWGAVVLALAYTVPFAFLAALMIALMVWRP